MSASASAGPVEVGVISAVYNHHDTVADTIESVLMQKTEYRVHHYLFNDASTDNSESIIQDYKRRYPERITLFSSTTNLGSGKKSILHHRPHISSKYWCLLAGDDYWTASDKIQKQVDLLGQTPTAVGCSSETLMKNEMNGDESIIRPAYDNWNLMDMLLGHKNLYVHPSSILWRNLFRETGSFFPPQYVRSSLSGDTLLLHMMLFDGGEIIHLPEVTSCYRVTGRGVWSRLTQEEKYARNRALKEYIHNAVPRRYRLAKYLLNSKRLSPIGRLLPLPEPVGEPAP